MGAGATQPARRAKRHAPRGALKTSLGRVVDLSSGGARIRCDSRPELKVQAATPLEIFLLAGSEAVNARVCWVRRRGLLRGHWELGLKFIAVPVLQQQRLALIAEKGYLPTDDEAPEPAAAAFPPPTAETAVGMAALRTHFEALELEVEASADDVRAAHRRLVRACHPDVAEGEEAKAKFLKLQNSYQILIDAFREREEQRAAA